MLYKFFAVFSAVVLSLFSWSAAAVPVRAQESDPLANNPAFKQTALKHLQQLVDIYQIDLSDRQRAEVVENCSRVLEQRIKPLREDWRELRREYDHLIETINRSLIFITDDLRQMSEDSSAINLASVKLNQVHSNFLITVDVYELILSELLALSGNCYYYPEAFVAGLHEMNRYYHLLQAAASDLLGFVGKDLQTAFNKIEQRLKILEK